MAKKSKGLKLDLACGDNKTKGYKGVDKFKTPSVDYECDLLEFPWPFADDSVEEIVCNHFFEHIPGLLRPKFMDELYRVMQPESKATFIVPYGQSNRAIQDFTHEWPPVIAESFLYFNRKWREDNKLTHGYYDMKCNFDFGYGYAMEQEFLLKSNEVQAFAAKYYINGATDMQITLTKR